MSNQRLCMFNCTVYYYWITGHQVVPGHIHTCVVRPHHLLQCSDIHFLWDSNFQLSFSPFFSNGGTETRRVLNYLDPLQRPFCVSSPVLLVIPHFSAPSTNMEVTELLSGCYSLHSSRSEVLHLTGRLTETCFVAKGAPQQAKKQSQIFSTSTLRLLSQQTISSFHISRNKNIRIQVCCRHQQFKNNVKNGQRHNVHFHLRSVNVTQQTHDLTVVLKSAFPRKLWTFDPWFSGLHNYVE